MNAMNLLQYVSTLHVSLSVEEGTLWVEDPDEAVDTDLLAQLSEQKSALIALLTGSPGEEQQGKVPAQRDPSPCQVSRRETFLSMVSVLAERYRQAPGLVALDLETTGLDARKQKVVSLALGAPSSVSILDLRPYYDLPEDEQRRWREALCTLFQTSGMTWVGQNLKFDWQFLRVHFGVRLDPVYDIMLAEQVLLGPERGQGREAHFFALPSIAARYQARVPEASRAKLAVSKEQRVWFVGLDQRPAEWHAPFPDEQLRYMCQDIEVPHRIRRLQHRELERHALTEVVALENRCLPAIAEMEMHGALVDRERWQRAIRAKQARAQALEGDLLAPLGQARQRAQDKQRAASQRYQEMLRDEEVRLMHQYSASDTLRGRFTWEAYRAQELWRWQKQHPQPPNPPQHSPAGSSPAINLTSSAQVIEALAGLGISLPSVREAVLEDLAPRYPLLAHLLEYRKLRHFCSAFGDNVLAFVQEDGRIHAHFAQVGAVSGRIICRQPNLQQMPKKREQEPVEEDIRRCFIAPPGHVLIKADLSNIELRILAEVSGDATMLRFFAEGRDLHAETARLMFHLPPETDTKAHLYQGVAVRDLAKAINFGLMYGMGARSLASRVNVSVEEARELMRAYFQTYPGINRWLRQTAPTAKRQGYTVSLAGRKRFLSFERLGDAAQASPALVARNHPIQATNADILKAALALLYDVLPSIGAHAILAVHDELVLECPVEHTEVGEGLLKEALVWACRTYLKRVHIPEPEVLTAPYWQKG